MPRVMKGCGCGKKKKAKGKCGCDMQDTPPSTLTSLVSQQKAQPAGGMNRYGN